MAIQTKTWGKNNGGLSVQTLMKYGGSGTTTTLGSVYKGYWVEVTITENSTDIASNTSNVTMTVVFKWDKTTGTGRFDIDSNTSCLRIGFGNSSIAPPATRPSDDAANYYSDFYNITNKVNNGGTSIKWDFRGSSTNYDMSNGRTYTKTIDVPHNIDGSGKLVWRVWFWAASSGSGVLFNSTGEMVLTSIPRIYISNGSSWKPGVPYVSDGSEWVQGVAKVSDGTGWKP